jgi:hypothetical protein
MLQAEEVERENKLILEGKIPAEEASTELMQHPVFKISQLTKKIIEDKKAKVSAVAHLPNYDTQRSVATQWSRTGAYGRC